MQKTFMNDKKEILTADMYLYDVTYSITTKDQITGIPITKSDSIDPEDFIKLLENKGFKEIKE